MDMKKKSILALGLLFGMLAVSSCATMDRLAAEQEEEMRQAVPGDASSGMNPRWEIGNWDYDYLSD
jgi:hypothetical protein